ncbi:MAG: tail-specific protease, partial [Bacteroidetes bacterium]
FSVNETFDSDVEHMPYAKNEAEIRERWRLALKYQTLSRLVNKLERQEKAQEEGNPEEVEMKSFALLEEEARQQVRKTYAEYFRRLERMDIADRRSDYLNAIAAVYDPHTNYFPPKDKEDFDISMSGRLEGIGATLREENGFIKVMSIVPGSASARQGQLEVNDKILKVAQGAEEPVDVVGMALDEAVKMIRGPKGTEVRLTIQKIDGSEMIVPIVRDIVVLEETYAKSVILENGQSADRIGYIHLPKFYVDFQDPQGRRCATDVAMELEKLQADGIDGLVLDLRDNGGGSLQDVVEMAGLFFDYGPVVQVKSRDDVPTILSDRDRKVHYDGPLVIMVNAFSASASEILAAAIQDYDRGVIVGSPHTFGKGTVQRFVNLDNYIRGGDEIKPLGEMKLTTQKFYRINGGATQLRGVESDIVLPDAYSLLEMGEKDQAYCMPWDEINPVGFKPWDRPVSAVLPDVQAASAARVAQSEFFQLTRENAERLKARQDQQQYPLELEAFRAERARTEAEAKRFQGIRPVFEDLEITTLSADVAHIEADSLRKKRIDTWHSNLRKDPYVYEAMEIVKDLP